MSTASTRFTCVSFGEQLLFQQLYMCITSVVDLLIKLCSQRNLDATAKITYSATVLFRSTYPPVSPARAGQLTSDMLDNDDDAV